MKAWKFLGAPLMFMLLTGMPWCVASAENSVTEPVTVEAGQHNTTVDDVNVENNDYAVKVIADQEGENKDSSATIKANVTLTNSSEGEENESVAVYATGSKDSASATVNGDVSANGISTMYGAIAEGSDSNVAGTADVTVNGNVSVKSRDESATGVELRNGESITVKENVTVAGQHAEGVHAYTNRESEVVVKGGVSATGGDYASGVRLETFGEASNLSLTVENGIISTSTGTKEYSGADGMDISNLGGTISADITGDVTTKSVAHNASGIRIGGAVVEGSVPVGDSKILIHGSLISDGVGIYADATGNPNFTEVLIQNELQAEKVGILSRLNPIVFEPQDNPGSSDGEGSFGGTVTSNLNLTVWKIKLNESGNVAEYDLNTGYSPDEIPPEGVVTHGRDEEMEKRIMYIIKVEQPSEGGIIKAVDENGNELDKSFDFDIAHEGDKVVLKANLAEGYKLIAAYNGLGEKMPLLKDENGDYYIIVPKGGGVYLSVELQKDENNEHHNAKPDDNGKTIDNDSENENAKEESTGSSANKLGAGNSSALKTGDNDQITPWLLLSVVSVGSVAGIEICNKKRSRKSI